MDVMCTGLSSRALALFKVCTFMSSRYFVKLCLIKGLVLLYVHGGMESREGWSFTTCISVSSPSRNKWRERPN